MSQSANIYDKRYLEGYRKYLSGYEFARWKALHHSITKLLKTYANDKLMVLDYGSGSGLFVDLWKKLFPNSQHYFADISKIALDNLKSKYPEYKDNCSVIINDRTEYKDSSFNVIVSVEVMEHVEDLEKYLDEIKRLLKENGIFIWTTPCGNMLSIEHMYSKVSGQIEKTDEGYRRWKWEDRGHIRRLKSGEIKSILSDKGFRYIKFKYRAHIFSFLCTKLVDKKMLSEQKANRLMELDYTLFRIFPNGASMIGFAKKGYHKI